MYQLIDKYSCNIYILIIYLFLPIVIVFSNTEAKKLESDELKFKMRERTIYKQGVAFVITLPIDWIRTQELKPGDGLVPVLQEDMTLLLVPKKVVRV